MNGSKLRVVALLAGDPQAAELWTLHKLAGAPGALFVVQARNAEGVSRGERLRRSLARHGMRRTLSRLIGSRVIGVWHERRRQRELDRLFGAERLRDWWRNSGIEVVMVPHLNHTQARAAIADRSPDLLVRVSGGLLRPEVFSLARLAALNIHHGQAPRIRGMWSLAWAILENRPDWIGATIHLLDDGIDTGRVLWRGAPQVAPGDTGTRLFFRAHREAVDALGELVRQYAANTPPQPQPVAEGEASTYRSAPGLGAWLRYLWLGQGTRAPVVLERAREP